MAFDPYRQLGHCGERAGHRSAGLAGIMRWPQGALNPSGHDDRG